MLSCESICKLSIQTCPSCEWWRALCSQIGLACTTFRLCWKIQEVIWRQRIQSQLGPDYCRLSSWRYLCTWGSRGESTDRSCSVGKSTRQQQCRWKNWSYGCGYPQGTLPWPWKCFVDKSLLHSHHLSKQTHSLSVWNLYVGKCISGCAVQDGERAWVIWVDEGSGWDEHVLHVSEY